MSITGKEVIATSVIAIVLILLYHILDIVLRKRRQKKEAKENPPQSVIDCSIKSTIEESFNDEYQRIFRYSTLFTVLLTIIVTTVALIIRWVLLQPIHDEIVDKYNRKVPIYYVQNSFCSYVSDQNLNVFTFSVACVLIITFVIVSKRQSFKPDLCRGYVAPLVPLNFFAHIERTYFAIVFATLSNHALNIIVLAFQQERKRLQGTVFKKNDNNF